MFRRITALFILVALAGVYVSPLATREVAASPKKNAAQKRHSKLAPEFETTGSAGELVRVLIQTKGRPSAAHDNAIASKGGSRGSAFEALDVVTALVPRGAVASLADREDVAYVSPDRLVTGAMAVTREATGAALAQAGVGKAPGVTGKGVGIAILDSGVSTSHPDFQKNGKSRVAASVDFTGGGTAVSKKSIVLNDGLLMGDGVDREGHGTGVAGVAAGNGAASAGYGESLAGIAPQASLLDLKVLDDHGVGTTSSVLGAVNWAIANQKRFNIRVMNLSLGAPVRESYHTDPLCKAVERAVLAGIVVVAAAGNDGRTDEIIGSNPDGTPLYRPAFGGIHSPGNSPYAITVGASDTRGTAARSDDRMAQFSSKGPTAFDHLAKPELVAPGRGVVAAMSQESPNSAAQRPDRVAQPTGANALRNAYYTYYGTSFAAPVVSGTVALMLEANRSLTPALVKAALVRTANALPGSLFASKGASALTQGAGQLNAAAAVELARAFVPNADKLKAGERVLRNGATVGGSFSIGGETVANANRVLYAGGVLFNEKPILTNGIVLNDGLLMGDGILMNDGLLMGDGIVLIDGLLMGDGVTRPGQTTLAAGIFMNDSIVLNDGLLMGDGIVLIDGFLMGDGILMNDGIVLNDGLLMGDKAVRTDGILMNDGIVLNDGLLMGDGIVLIDGILLGDGFLMGDGIVLIDGVLSDDGLLMGDGFLMGDGLLMGDRQSL
ncbi:MAG TPA: S8 family serine peptidase [Pyrinomonadaceae bacterium]|jgi:subtilisin family serine protease